MNNYQIFKQNIEKANSIIILSHVNPDGDTLGGMLALGLTIKKNFKKSPVMLALNNIQDLYGFMPGIEDVKLLENFDTKQKFDMAIAVDVASKDRMITSQELFNNAKYTVNIDHHKTNNNYGNLNFVNAKASSASEVAFEIIKKMELKIDKKIATNIYAGIMTDTGSFKYENTGVRTFEIASELISLGANPCEISKNYYDKKPKSMISLHAYCVNNAVFKFNDRVAYTIITNNDLKKCHAKTEQTEGIGEILRQIKSVEIALVLKETDSGYTKVSMRSKNIDCSKIAEKYQGGGHTFAAGCTIKKIPKIAINKLLEDIEKIL